MVAKKYLESNIYNSLFTIVITAISFVLYHQSGVLDNAGMAAIILNWFPITIGIVTILAYFFAKICRASWAWMLTLLGAFFNVLLVFSAFFGG